MSEEKFIQHIGDYRLHDGIIEEIIERKEEVEIFIRGCNGDLLKFTFFGTSKVRRNESKGMMIYSVSEMSCEEDTMRHFVFINWDETSKAFLEVIAESFEIQLVEE
ncbi:hypothetical protein [Alkaliphilus peptidifermentans]|uniref:Uncharacterized protein n=1 Tax=Alkaliphilus peptidifermentans DSM 18978 TaxID=1120976 RepID=A0A1G5LDC8_9FIRM|nr:hypothetical protein [Alkaliphilus peptidifermentans]SCZ10806.1 hypothetical protein SAMN03080606_04314 [Alkaliphilus peptidifermentans DSM 18978]